MFYHKTNFWFFYNGYKNIDFDVQVVQRPNIPAPVKKVSYIDVAGVDGGLTETDGTYEHIEIKVPMNFIVTPKENFWVHARKVKNWLSDSGELEFSDDPDVFYKVKNARLDSEIERIMRRAGSFSALFTCDPYTYFKAGRTLLPVSECELNPYRLSKPKYHIEGNGTCKLTVNGTDVLLAVNGDLIVDTTLMAMYKEDGTIQNNKSRCPYEKLFFNPGRNHVSITSGHILRIEPNWRSL